MNRVEFSNAIADRLNSTKEDKDPFITKKAADAYLTAFLATVEDVLASGDKIRIIGFGTFEVAERSARMGRNPKTGESVQIPATKTPKFKPAQALKDAVNGDGE